MLLAKISPSVMCADISRIGDVLRELGKAGADYLHIDVMDGVFVPNLMLCDTMTRQFRRLTDIPFDYHLMITSPESKIGWFDIRPGDMVSLHWESSSNVRRAIPPLKAAGAKVGLALNPATPIGAVEYLLDDLDFVLLMTVDPGFAGQSLIPAALRKISDLRRFLDARGADRISIEVDGCVSVENAKRMRANGADIFVAGTSSVFNNDMTLEQGMATLRSAVTWCDTR